MADKTSLQYIIISGILISLFAISLTNFSINMGREYDLNETEVSSPFFNISSLESKIAEGQNISSASLTNLTAEKTWLQTLLDVLPIAPMFKFVKDTWNLVTAPLTILIYALRDVLHVPDIAIYSVVTILFITIGFALWRLWKTGE